MKLQLSIKSILDLHHAISDLIGWDDLNWREKPKTYSGLSTKIKYAIKKTKDKLKPIVDAVAEMQKGNPVLDIYESRRIDLARKHSHKDENGKAKMFDEGTQLQRFDIIDMPLFQEEWKKLKDEYKSELEAQKNAQKEIEEHLKNIEEVEVFQISMDDMLSNIPMSIFENLWPLFKDELEESGPKESKP